jgi:DHA1 family multidrug resistance protein-like MFS transporter
VIRLPRFNPWERTVWGTVVAEILTLLAFNASALLIPYYIQQMGITEPARVAAWTGAYQSAGGISFAIFTPIWGAVGDRYGRRLMLLRAMAATALILCLMGVARSPTQLLVLRLIQGSVTGTPAAATALLASGSPKKRLAYTLGLLQTAVFVGASLGPMFGGFIADTFGYRATFFVSSAIVLVALIITLTQVREPEGHEESQAQSRQQNAIASFRTLLGSTRLLMLIAMAFMANATVNLISPVLPVFIQHLVADSGRLASTAGTVSGVAALSAAVSALVVGRYSDRVGYRKMLLICAAGTTLLYVPLGLAGSVLVLGALVAAQGLFRGGISPNINAMVVNTASPEKTGAALGLSSSAFSMGFAVGPILGAAFMAATSIRGVFFLAGALFGLVTLAVAIVNRRMASPARAADSPASHPA